jgi:hypothetical protein
VACCFFGCVNVEFCDNDFGLKIGDFALEVANDSMCFVFVVGDSV